MSIDGVLNIIKPRGKTSFQVVSWIRRLTEEHRVGHGGTLDPEASGVLPVFLGQGTKVIQFLSEWSKTYVAQIQLGVSTDTYDATGKVTCQGNPAGVTEERLREALNSFRGAIEQTPPLYSAVRYKGKRFYHLARAGIEVERKKKQVHIFHLELIEWQFPCFTIEIECSSGTYIRSIANDLGNLLGCGAHLKDLVRLRCGLFHLEDGITPPVFEEAFHHSYWQEFLHPVDEVLSQSIAIIVAETTERAIREGRPLFFPEHSGDPGDFRRGVCRAYSTSGHFLAVLRLEAAKHLWHPYKVFPSADQPPPRMRGIFQNSQGFF